MVRLLDEIAARAGIGPAEAEKVVNALLDPPQSMIDAGMYVSISRISDPDQEIHVWQAMLQRALRPD